MGDEGKAVGCVPPTALLSLHSAGRAVNFDLDQRARAQSCGGIVMTVAPLSQKGAAVLQSVTKATRSLVAFFPIASCTGAVPAAVTSVTTPQWFTCFAVTAPVVTGRAFSSLTGAAAMWCPLFTDRHGVVINPNLAFKFPLLPSLGWRSRRADFFSRHRQVGMGSDPIDSIFFGSEFSKVMHGTIRPYYLYAPNVAFTQRQ